MTASETEELVNKAEHMVKLAIKKGANAADAFAVSSESVSAGMRLGLPEAIERAEEKGLGLRVFVGKSHASVSSSDFNETALDTLVQSAVQMAKAAPADPYAALADPSQMGKSEHQAALDLVDNTAISIEALQKSALICEETGRAHKGITNSEGAYAGFGRFSAGFYASSGVSFTHSATQHSLSLSLIAGETEHMQRDYAYHTTHFQADLDAPETIANAAAKRTLERMNPRKIPSGKMAIIFDPRVGKQLLSAFASAINGASIARGTSFLKDQMGKAVFADNIQVIDDPLITRGLGSQACDDEGVRVQKQQMITNGVLNSWFLDIATANQLGLETTGHASRSLGGSPSPSSSNLYIAAGSDTPQALMAQFDQAFYVTETFGHGVNIITGDYSQGAGGFLLEKGVPTYPVSEVTIAGNLRDMLLALQAANDLEMRYATNVPTLIIPDMTVAGA
jgi:PmbA protein